MPSKKPYLVTPNPIPIENLSLGRLVPDIANPTQDAYTTPNPTDEDIQKAPQNTYKSLVASHKKTSVRAHLIALGFDMSRELDNKLIIDSTIGKSYELREPTAWFSKICEAVEARRWLQTMDDNNRDIFFVSGFRTWSNATVTVEKTRGTSYGGDGDLPVDTIASLAGTALPVSLGLGLGAGSTVERSKTEKVSYYAPGEQVYAIQYRRVKLNRSTKAKYLHQSTCWRDVLSQRGEEDTDGFVDAEVAVALRLALPNEQVDEGDGEKYIVLTS
ncbi:hypothetical protein MMC18_003521 [Xylographa bjoerkii]|nr:hypothetical protein [Xylographa bjoerkii]